MRKIPMPVMVMTRRCIFYVPEGTGVVGIGDERESVDKDTIVESPAMQAHTSLPQDR
jgi:hypothetical protein